jgi:hypothetical protein
MKHPHLWCSFFVKAAFVFGFALVSLKPCIAQDFTIMVNGSWTFVPDPTPTNDPNKDGDKVARVVLVAPAFNADHVVFIYQGVDAAHPTMGTPNIQPALYYLDFDLGIRTFRGRRGTGEQLPNPYSPQQTVSGDAIKTIIYHRSDVYAISLPTPDYYTTYDDHGFGVAESKISDQTPITISNPHSDYTNWMVLHYQVAKPVVAMTQSMIITNNGVPGQPVPGSAPAEQSSISIVMMPPNPTSRYSCDFLSRESFGQTEKLWNLALHARFPVEADSLGTQERGTYDYTCDEADAAHAAMVDSHQKQEAFLMARKPRCVDATLRRVQLLEAGVTAEPSKKSSSTQVSPNRDAVCEVRDESTGPVACAPDAKDVRARDAFCDIRSSLSDLSFSKMSAPVQHDVDCLGEVVRVLKPGTCEAQERAQVFAKVALDVVLLAMGSTDCHAPQINLNGAVQ